MTNTANSHDPKLHLFQAVTDFVKIDVEMMFIILTHIFCTTIPTSVYNFVCLFTLIFYIIIMCTVCVTQLFL